MAGRDGGRGKDSPNAQPPDECNNQERQIVSLGAQSRALFAEYRGGHFFDQRSKRGNEENRLHRGKCNTIQ